MGQDKQEKYHCRDRGANERVSHFRDCGAKIRSKEMCYMAPCIQSG